MNTINFTAKSEKFEGSYKAIIDTMTSDWRVKRSHVVYVTLGQAISMIRSTDSTQELQLSEIDRLLNIGHAYFCKGYKTVTIKKA